MESKYAIPNIPASVFGSNGVQLYRGKNKTLNSII